jgi:hypothetical protein
MPGLRLEPPFIGSRVGLCLLCEVCNAPRMLIIGLVLAGWAVASVVVAVLASTVFHGARIGPETIKLPPDVIDLTTPDVRTQAASPEQPETDTAQ